MNKFFCRCFKNDGFDCHREPNLSLLGDEPPKIGSTMFMLTETRNSSIHLSVICFSPKRKPIKSQNHLILFESKLGILDSKLCLTTSNNNKECSEMNGLIRTVAKSLRSSSLKIEICLSGAKLHLAKPKFEFQTLFFRTAYEQTWNVSFDALPERTYSGFAMAVVGLEQSRNQISFDPVCYEK